jgi:hypothetical protein
MSRMALNYWLLGTIVKDIQDIRAEIHHRLSSEKFKYKTLTPFYARGLGAYMWCMDPLNFKHGNGNLTILAFSFKEGR